MAQPLRGASVNALLKLRGGPVICQQFNPGVVRKLLAEGLAELVDLPSPVVSHRGKSAQHLRITDLGRTKLTTSE